MSKRSEVLERAKEVAMYIVDNKATIRQAAREFGVSKSTIHRYITTILMASDRRLYGRVRKVLDYNTSQRAIRGGMSTKTKFETKK